MNACESAQQTLSLKGGVVQLSCHRKCRPSVVLRHRGNVSCATVMHQKLVGELGGVFYQDAP